MGWIALSSSSALALDHPQICSIEGDRQFPFAGLKQGLAFNFVEKMWISSCTKIFFSKLRCPADQARFLM